MTQKYGERFPLTKGRNPQPFTYISRHRTPKWVSFQVSHAKLNMGAEYVSYSADRYDEEVLARIPKVPWTFDD